MKEDEILNEYIHGDMTREEFLSKVEGTKEKDSIFYKCLFIIFLIALAVIPIIYIAGML